jgi:hypothetical protein
VYFKYILRHIYEKFNIECLFCVEFFGQKINHPTRMAGEIIIKENKQEINTRLINYFFVGGDISSWGCETVR